MVTGVQTCALPIFAMLNLRSFAKWVRGILDSEEAYNLPEDVYNDVIPSGVHDFCRFDREY